MLRRFELTHPLKVMPRLEDTLSALNDLHLWRFLIVLLPLAQHATVTDTLDKGFNILTNL